LDGWVFGNFWGVCAICLIDGKSSAESNEKWTGTGKEFDLEPKRARLFKNSSDLIILY
jgi:hypothetical protein